nr:MAG TPA: hypothetical protein [Caudoviricetes sp.]
MVAAPMRPTQSRMTGTRTSARRGSAGIIHRLASAGLFRAWKRATPRGQYQWIKCWRPFCCGACQAYSAALAA